MGRITAIGKTDLRGTLVEIAWRLIGKDPTMMRKYERIKARAGSITFASKVDFTMGTNSPAGKLVGIFRFS